MDGDLTGLKAIHKNDLDTGFNEKPDKLNSVFFMYLYRCCSTFPCIKNDIKV
jgi:hypothetical protein